MELFDGNTSEFLSNSIDFETELFPEVKTKSWPVEQNEMLINNQIESSLSHRCDSRSEDAMSYDSDASGGGIIDVGEPEHVLKTSRSSEADEELVSYLTGVQSNNANQEINRNSMKIVKILTTNMSAKHVTCEPRVLKIDSSGNKRMLHAVRVLNQPQIMKLETSNKSVISNDWGQDSRYLSKSAIAARENREKKKRYVAELEKSVKDLANDNKILKEQNASFIETVDNLKKEVAYLKSVLANQSTLSKLLQNIPGIPDISIASSEKPVKTKYNKRMHFDVGKDENENDEASGSVSKKRVKNEIAPNHTENFNHSVSDLSKEKSQGVLGGVCLHVSGSTVSLELCATCNQKAKTPSL